MSVKTYQIQVSLNGLKPKIWRRIMVEPQMLLPDFHKVIQTTMGWTNSHLHQFIKDRTFYTLQLEEDDFWSTMDNVDYSKTKVSDLLKKEKDKIIYEYDFGDSWEHTVLLEKIVQTNGNEKLPLCLAGKNNCPPEDCGGVWGYANMIEILKKKKHEEYEDYLEWLGEEFEPALFDKEAINASLRTDDYGCLGFF